MRNSLEKIVHYKFLIVSLVSSFTPPAYSVLYLLPQPISGDIEWDKTTQGWVLSSFFYGYIITQVPGGWLSGRFGGKRVMLIGLFIFGLVTVVLPFAAR